MELWQVISKDKNNQWNKVGTILAKNYIDANKKSSMIYSNKSSQLIVYSLGIYERLAKTREELEKVFIGWSQEAI